MARYTQLNTQQINRLAKLYNLSIDSYQPMEGGAANSSYLLTSAQGRYVLTVYEDQQLKQVTMIGKTLWHLAKHKFSTVVIVPTIEGDAAVLHAGKPVLVKEYIQGKVVQHMDDRMLAQVGAALAQLHQIPSPDYLTRQHPYGLELFSTFLGLDIDPEYDAWLSERTGFLEEHTPTNLPKALIHGDLFYDNVLFHGRSFKAIIDFEEVCFYHKVFDLGMALLGICSADGNLDMEMARTLMAGYLGDGNMGDLERETLQLMLETAAVATSCWRFRKYNLDNPTPDRKRKHWEMAHFADYVHSIDKGEFMAAVFGG